MKNAAWWRVFQPVAMALLIGVSMAGLVGCTEEPPAPDPTDDTGEMVDDADGYGPDVSAPEEPANENDSPFETEKDLPEEAESSGADEDL